MRVEVAFNGRDALTLLEREPFDVVLMDTQMPIMNGYEATRAIRRLADPCNRAIPIVAVTSNMLPGARGACLTAGMNAYISKPFRGSLLVELVERLAGRRAAQ